MSTPSPFTATILEGHKGPAFELPFDPGEQWSLPAQQIEPGRRGWFVRVRIGRMTFDSTVVTRSKRFWVLVDDAAMQHAGRAVGDSVRVTVAPRVEQSARKNAATVSADRAETLVTRARAWCLSMPEAYEKIAHGAPNFRVGDRVFVMVANNHHHDGRIALWCNAPLGEQQACVEGDPDHFFVPPYVGTKGWIGVRLDKSLAASAIRGMIELAYRTTLEQQAAKRPRKAR